MENAYQRFDRLSMYDLLHRSDLEDQLNQIKAKHRYQIDTKPIVDIQIACEKELNWGIKTRFSKGEKCKYYWYQVFQFLDEWIEELANSNVSEAKKTENQVLLSQATDHSDTIRKRIASFLKGIVREQGQSATWVVNRYYGRMALAHCRMDTDYPILLDSWGRMAKGSNEEKTMGHLHFGFKLHFGDDLFLRFEYPREGEPSLLLYTKK